MRKRWRTAALTFALLVLPAVVGGDGREPGHTGKRVEAQVEAHASVQHATAHFRSAIQASPDEPANYVQLMQALFLDDQRAELESTEVRIATPRFQWLAGLAFLLLLADGLVGGRRRRTAIVEDGDRS